MKVEPIETFCLYGFIFEKFAYSFSDKPDAKSSPARLHLLKIKNQFGKKQSCSQCAFDS
jgi:hypothetical protein